MILIGLIIPHFISHLTKLSSLYVYELSFEGFYFLFFRFNVFIFDVFNLLDNQIPSWISQLSQLTYLILCNCLLSGSLPSHLPRHLPYLRDLSLRQNNFQGF